MKIHNIKIEDKYYKRLLDKQKTFEIRKNDRDYQVGDRIVFDVIDGEPIFGNIIYWKITYLHYGLGMKDDYVVLSVVKDEPRIKDEALDAIIEKVKKS